jgi:hypothetical protein
MYELDKKKMFQASQAATQLARAHCNVDCWFTGRCLNHWGALFGALPATPWKQIQGLRAAGRYLAATAEEMG